jgi:hypothetical protein
VLQVLELVLLLVSLQLALLVYLQLVEPLELQASLLAFLSPYLEAMGQLSGTVVVVVSGVVADFLALYFSFI